MRYVSVIIVAAACLIMSCGRSDPWSSSDCGNGSCEGKETVSSCPEDCNSKAWQCGNGVCEPGESAFICPADCLGVEQGCGDGTCSSGETPENCPADCLAGESICGNGTCEAEESVASCPNDCAWLPIFGGQCIGNECVLNDDADTTFEGTPDGLAGSAVAIVGDMDGDNMDEIVIGAKSEDRNGEDSGTVYVLYGRSEGFNRAAAITNADAVIPGERSQDSFGWSISDAGDVNGDGLNDMLVGAPAIANDGGPGQGQVYLIPGKTERLEGQIDLHKDIYDLVKFVDSETVGSAGWSVAGAGDSDRDGLDDFLIGAPGRSDGDYVGAVYLIYGREDWERDGFYDPIWIDDLAVGWINSHDKRDLGGDISISGDINGDGNADVLMGATGMGSTSEFPGGAYLVFGENDRMTEFSSTDDADVLLESSTVKHPGTGQDVSFVGDLDADGYDEMIVGKPDFESRTVYLFYGSPDASGGTWDLEEADAIFMGEMVGYSGPNVVSAGDINGDGFDDLLIGAGYEGKSAVYLFLGGSQRILGHRRFEQANSVFFIEPDNKDECLGFAGSAVSGGGDVNGDGFDDFLIGARGNCSGGGAIGYVYLVLGAGVP